MGDVTTTTTFVGVIGMVETAADTAKDQMRPNMVTVRSVSAATLMYPIRVMANARCLSGVETATVMTAIIIADAIGTAGIAVDNRHHFCTVKNAVVKIQTSKALCALNPVMRVPGKETKLVMTKIITAVAVGTVATAAAPPKNTTIFTARSVNVWTRKINLN